MSDEMENRAETFYAGVEERFKSLGSLVAIEANEILETVVAAYKVDLAAMNSQSRILDDIIAIAGVVGLPEEKYRKIHQVLLAKGKVKS